MIDLNKFEMAQKAAKELNCSNSLTYRNNMSRKRIYNRVMDDSNRMCPTGRAAHRKELEFIRLHSPREDWPNTAKVTVKTGEIYFSFGVRFAESYELVKQENSNGE